jgi:hypothetical protein
MDVDGCGWMWMVNDGKTMCNSRLQWLKEWICESSSPTLRPSESKWTGTTTISIGGSDCCMMRPGEANGSKWIAAFAHHYEFAILKSCCKRSWSLVPWYSLVLCHLIWWFHRFMFNPTRKIMLNWRLQYVLNVARWFESTNTKQFYS